MKPFRAHLSFDLLKQEDILLHCAEVFLAVNNLTIQLTHTWGDPLKVGSCISDRYCCTNHPALALGFISLLVVGMFVERAVLSSLEMHESISFTIKSRCNDC